MGFWRKTDAGHEYSCPGEHGVYVEGPLTADDLKHIIGDLVEALADLARREGKEGEP